MEATRRSSASVVMLAGLCVAGAALWWLHASAWDVGRRSPVLNYDSAQYALAARELAEHGRLATPFALPVELVRHPRPPWPLAVVQPGLVLAEAALFKLAPGHAEPAPAVLGPNSAPRDSSAAAEPGPSEWLALLLPFAGFLLIGALLGWAAERAARGGAGVTPPLAAAAGAIVGVAFLLDPEAQHLATGGFTEMPFTLGLIAALLWLAAGAAARWPLLWGLLLGFTGLFRGNMLWLVPALVAGATAIAPRERRVRVALLALAGYALPLAPWWAYKARSFGTPAWDLSLFAMWEGIEGRTWFSLLHLPAMPALPHGGEAVRLLLGKLVRNFPHLLLQVLTGPRALWVGTLAVYAARAGGPRERRVAALVTLVILACNLIAASIGVPFLRYLFPARVPVEAAGLLAAFALLARLKPPDVSVAMKQALIAFVALLALGWGVRQTLLGLEEAKRTAEDRGIPQTATLEALGRQVQSLVPAGEPVMSNLGPNLAWVVRRPVVHLALTPADVDACRRRLDFHHVIVVFRDASRAWPGWTEVIEHPGDAPRHAEWNVRQAREYRSEDGFVVVWLELGPLAPEMASNLRAPR